MMLGSASMCRTGHPTLDPIFSMSSAIARSPHCLGMKEFRRPVGRKAERASSCKHNARFNLALFNGRCRIIEFPAEKCQSIQVKASGLMLVMEWMGSRRS